MIKCGIFIDGFNLYHSLKDAATYTGCACVKWLNIASLCNFFIHGPVRSFLRQPISCECIHYYSAIPNHAPSLTRKRHNLYMQCLSKTGIEVHLGNYRKRTAICKLCKGQYTYHEEKETDVAIGVGILQHSINTELDAVIIVSGDSDLVPAFKSLKEMRPCTATIAAMPYKRSLNAVKNSVDHHLNIKPARYIEHQFNDPHVFPDGTNLSKPLT
jgi:uncharacterized LabA/DUF88 family protein